MRSETEQEKKQRATMQNWRHLEGDEAPVKRYLMTDAYKERSPKDESKRLLKVAATYSPTTQCSTIGDAELNDPVRNGKGWDLSAITT